MSTTPARGPSGSAWIPPRRAGKTAAPASRVDQHAAAVDSSGAEPGLAPERATPDARGASGSRRDRAASRSAAAGPPQCGHARTSKLQRRPGEESATIHRRASPSASSRGGRCRHLPALGKGMVGRPQRVRAAFNAHSRTKTRIGSLLRPRGSLPLRPPAPLRVTLAVGGALLATQTAETLCLPIPGRRGTRRLGSGLLKSAGDYCIPLFPGGVAQLADWGSQ